jgi:glutamyl-Q tRNA(Asp) synthetase
LRTDDEPIRFVDRLQGPQEQRLESESGDFVIWRRDGLVAYHLAVVVDDHLQGITEIVRGTDLMDSTPRQIHVQRCLGFDTPDYAHIPVAVHADGSKLSKLTGATAVPDVGRERTLVDALRALGQQPPGDLAGGTVDDVWRWARENWRIDVLQGRQSVAAPGSDGSADKV